MFLNGLSDLFLLKLLDYVLARLLVPDENLGSHVHLQLLLGDVLDRVPQLCVWLLRHIGVFEVHRPFHDESIEQLWVLK